MDTLKKWWPTILPILMTIFVAIAPALQQLIAHHPVAASILSTIGWIVAHLKNSPLLAKGAK